MEPVEEEAKLEGPAAEPSGAEQNGGRLRQRTTPEETKRKKRNSPKRQ